MSTLIVEDLFTGIVFSQPIRVRRNVSISNIRPWIYINGTLTSGDLQCRVLQGANELAVSTINYVDINTVKTETYAHGFIRFDFESLILNKADQEPYTEYILEFSMINYIDDPSNYISIVRDWDGSAATLYNNSQTNDYIDPVGYEIFEYRSF